MLATSGIPPHLDGWVECGRDAEPVAAGVDAEFVLAATQVLDERLAPHDHDRGEVPLWAAHRPQPGLEPAVIAFDAVVGVALGDVARVGTSFSTARIGEGALSVTTSVGRR